jgi:hypothetical protein
VSHFLASADYIQVADAHMILDAQFLYTDYHIEMTDYYIVADLTRPGIDDTQPDVNALAYAVTKEQPVTCSHQKRGQQSNQGKHEQPEFAYSMHGDPVRREPPNREWSSVATAPTAAPPIRW